MPAPRTIKRPKNISKLGLSRIKKAVATAYRYNTCHIIYDPKSASKKPWIVKSVRNTIGEKAFEKQSSAVEYARKIQNRHKFTDIVIHGKSGKIEKSVRHGTT